MPLQQHLQFPKDDTKRSEKINSLLNAMGHSLSRKFHEYKGARYDKEREWERAIRQYEGDWESEDLQKIERALSMDGGGTDPISVNITRPKTNVAIARMKDIQFPTGGDFNFYLKSAPLTPEQKQALKEDQPNGTQMMAAAEQGMPQQGLPSPAEMTQGIQETNIERCPKMERKLRNRMIYADYGRKARLSMEDLCIKGTAVLKGPTIQDRKHRRYEEAETSAGESIQVLEEIFVPEPTVERVDPLYFFPDPEARLPDEIEDAFELHPLSASALRELTKNPAFMTEQVRKVLDTDPDGTDIPDIVVRTSRERSSRGVYNRYWVREYRGPLDKEVLYNAGMLDEEDFNDSLKQYTGEVWYCNKTIIRMSLSHIEGEDQLPYSLTVWEKDSNSVFGHGHPYLLRNAQRTVNNAYLMLLDNASLTSGPQIVLNKEMIEPASRDEDYSIEPMKVWFLTEYGADVREAMQFIDIPAQMQGIQQIIDAAMQFADVESATPLLQQGEMPSGNNTTTGVAMVMSATNILQKSASMNWDDYVTKPLVSRFYHYEMQYGEDPEVKGDFEVEIGGATERIEAQIRSQEIERMLGLAGSNEEFMLHVDPNKAFRALVDNTRTGDVLRSMEEVKQLKAEMEQAAQQQQQQDPEMLKAQASMIQAEATKMKAEADLQAAQAKGQQSQMEAQLKYQATVADAEARNNEAAMRYQMELAKMAQERDTSVAALQKDLQLKDMEYAMKLDLAEIDFEKFEREIQVKNTHGTGI